LQIFRKALALLDDLQRYDPIEDGKGGHPMGGGKFTKPGGHYFEINMRKRGLGKDIVKYLKECFTCKDDNDKGPKVPRWVTEMANRPVAKPVFVVPRSWAWANYIPGSPQTLEEGAYVSAGVGATAIALTGVGLLVEAGAGTAVVGTATVETTVEGSVGAGAPWTLAPAF
jgi:hypothetical protein